MNKENLIKMAEFILTIPQEKFAMNQYRTWGDDYTPECNTVGCVIGHCIILDPNIRDYYDKVEGCINFSQWSTNFTEISYMEMAWKYMFAGEWYHYDNTPQGAHDRIMNVVNGLNVTSEHLPWMR